MKTVRKINSNDDAIQEKYDVLYYSVSSNQIFIKPQQLCEPKTIVTYVDGSVIEYDIVGNIDSERGVPTTQIDNIENAVTIAIGYSVTSIGDWAFSSCANLKSVIIPESVTSIGAQAFYFSNVENMTIPNTVRSIGSGAFSYTAKITNMTLPKSITIIAERLFDSSSLESMVIPNLVTTIGNYGFAYNPYMISVVIPNSVTSIGDYVFQGCSSLTNITFEGTIAEWQLITKGSGWHGQVIATVVHCTDGDTALD